MWYEHRFIVKAPVEWVSAFHMDPTCLSAITPPPVSVRVERAPIRIADGAELAFFLGVGPFRLRWVAGFTEVSLAGFTDRQLIGPFSWWVHRHEFTALEDGTTEVRDRLDVGLLAHPVWGPVGLAMRLSFPVLFAFRSWRTRRILEG